ncbi:DUF4259 domain-containing protein [Streptomyces sp. S-9]|uniref:DUF4259 domain-containing protein n=2 Tax=Streptomyces TaxID=1883 RepID=UPI003486700D
MRWKRFRWAAACQSPCSRRCWQSACQWLLEPCLRPRQPYQEQCMGTWGTGPFDSDLAADFVDGLEGLTHQQVIDVLERAFQRVTDSGERVDGGDGAEAVAASALVASTLPDSPIVMDPDDGLRESTAKE